MKRHFKSHISKLMRYQTSLGRDLDTGLRLDRNERVSNLPKKVVADIFKRFAPYSFSASPESERLYKKIGQSLNIPKEKIYLTSGITEGIRILFEMLTNPGENVIVLDPTYPMYSIYAQMYQTEYRKFGYKQDLSLDWESLYSNIDDNTTLVMIPNPNLPIESALTIEEVRSVAQSCREHNAILVIDEAYHYFGVPTVLNLIDEYDNLVVMRSFSKAYGLASIRLGFMVSAAENIQYISKTRSIVESNTFSMGIAEYMLDHPEFMRKHAQEVREGSIYLQDELTRLGLRWHGGKFTNGILVFLDSNDTVNDLIGNLRKKKIYIRGAFEPPYDSCIRISIGPRKIMKIFVEALSEWIIQKKKASRAH